MICHHSHNSFTLLFNAQNDCVRLLKTEQQKYYVQIVMRKFYTHNDGKTKRKRKPRVVLISTETFVHSLHTQPSCVKLPSLH